MNTRCLSSKQKIELVLLIIITVYFAVLAVCTPAYSAKSRLFPTIVLIFGAGMLMLKFLGLFFPQIRKKLEPEKQDEDLGLEYEVNEEETEPVDPKKLRKSVASVILWIVLTAALIYFVGLIWATLIAVFFFFWLIARMKWYQALLGAVLLTAAIYLIFKVALKMRLYSGIFF